MTRFVIRCGMLVLICLLLLGCTLLGWLHWRTAPSWNMPLQVAGISMHLGIPELIRLTTHPAVIHLASGHQITTGWGRFRIFRDGQGTLLRCAPCTLDTPLLGKTALHFAYLDLRIHRKGDQLWGSLSSDAVTLYWQATLTEQNLEISGILPVTSAQEVYAVFRKNIPELSHTKIQGTIGGTFSLSLPDHHWKIDPDIKIARVAGLGTEQLKGRHIQANCSRPTPKGFGSRIGSAVIAAEDQRFAEHLGYDPRELSAALSPSDNQLGLPRGASTIDEQLARILFTGAGRNPIRKMRELLYAVEMDRTLGKAGILRMYLEIAPWGDGLCGAEAAAQHYFHKSTRSLTVREAAWMASLLRAPELARNNPLRVTQHALWIVQSMRHIPRHELRTAKAGLEANLAKLESK